VHLQWEHSWLVGAQCLGQWRNGLLLGNDPHRLLWHRLNLFGAAATATIVALSVATLALAAAALTLAAASFNVCCPAASFATALAALAITLAAAALALSAATLALAAAALALAAASFNLYSATVSCYGGDCVGEQHRRPDQCTRKHSRQPHCPCTRRLLPQR